MNQELLILLIDDEEINIEILSSMLKDKYRFIVAYDGQKGYELYQKYSPQIIISDIVMPKMNGIEMAKKIRQKDHNTKIIFLTSHSEVNYLLQSTDLKLSKYCLKPIEKEELFEAIKNAFSELKRFNTVYNEKLKIDENYSWDFINLELIKDKEIIKLTPKEKEILNFLLKNRGRLITYEELIYAIWDDNESSSDKTLKTMITNLRKKIPESLIENVYAIGYRVILP